MKDIITKFAANTYDAGNPTVNEFTNAGGTGDNLPETIIGIINAVIGVLGIVAVVVIIIGGISYMTSSGDTGKVKKAKDTILYGVIGLVICILAFAIVNFVISNIIKS